MHGHELRVNQEKTDTSVKQVGRGSSLRTDHILATTNSHNGQNALETVEKGGKLTERREIMSAITELSRQVLRGRDEVKMLPDHTNQDREKLRESLRSIVKEYRQQGISRSTAPDLRNMTEGQILLEALSKPDWSKKLQEKGIEVNEPTLELISQKLKGMNSPKPLDYNPAVSNFNETLDKSTIKDVAALRVEPAGLKGGIFYEYDKHSQQYYGRIMTLTDPEGRAHVFNKGECDDYIAHSTAKWIEFYRNQYVAKWTEHWAGRGYRLTDQQIESYKAKYDEDEGEALTANQVMELQEGSNSRGWSCTKLTRFPLKERVFCTDAGSKIYALDLSDYEPESREEHDGLYPYPTLGDPTPTYNCHGDFINREAWLIPEKRGEEGDESQIRTILTENNYYPVTNARVGDMVAYHKPDGSISHTATVVDSDPSRTIVESKLGEMGCVQHEMYDNGRGRRYGQPTIYRTEREGGHLLLSEQEWKAVTSQASSEYPNQSGG